MKFPSIKINENELDFRRFVKYGIWVVILGMAGNIIFSLLTTDRGIFQVLFKFRPRYFLLAITLAFVPWLTNTLRLMIWTRFLDKKIPFSELFKIILSQDLGSAISPTAIGGGYVKAGMLINKGMTAGAAASLMSLGTVEDGLFFLFAVPTAFIVSSCWELPVIRDIIHHLSFARNYLIAIAIMLAVLIVLIVLLRNKQLVARSRLLTVIQKKASKVWQDFKLVYILIVKRGKTRFFASITLSALQWICRYSVVTALLASLNVPVDPVLFFLFQWMTFTIMTLIPTPGAAAGAEASFYFMYAAFIPKEFLGVMTLGWRFLTFYMQVSISILFIMLFYLGGFAKKSANASL